MFPWYRVGRARGQGAAARLQPGRLRARLRADGERPAAAPARRTGFRAAGVERLCAEPDQRGATAGAGDAPPLRDARLLHRPDVAPVPHDPEPAHAVRDPGAGGDRLALRAPSRPAARRRAGQRQLRREARRQRHLRLVAVGPRHAVPARPDRRQTGSTSTPSPGARIELFTFQPPGGGWRGSVKPALLRDADVRPGRSSGVAAARGLRPRRPGASMCSRPAGPTGSSARCWSTTDPGSGRSRSASPAQRHGDRATARGPTLQATTGVTLGGQSFGAQTTHRTYSPEPGTRARRGPRTAPTGSPSRPRARPAHRRSCLKPERPRQPELRAATAGVARTASAPEIRSPSSVSTSSPEKRQTGACGSSM